jgi:hypothetical protein
VTSPFRPLRSSQLWVQCEECRLQANLSKAGTCRRCRRVLCDRHLHGSFFRKLLVDLGADLVCVRCRAEAKA